MIPLNPRALIPGQRLPQALYTRTGVKLLSQGAELTEDLCRSLRASGNATLFLANSARELHEQHALETGGRATMRLAPALSASTVDVPEEEIGLATLSALTGARFAVAPPDAVPTETERRVGVIHWLRRVRSAQRQLDQHEAVWSVVPRRVEPSEHTLDLSSSGRPGWPEGGRLAGMRDDRVQRHSNALDRVAAGWGVDVTSPMILVEELIDQLVGYPDRYAQLALLAPRRMDYLPDHSFTTAALSVAIAARMGWSPHDVALAGLTGLFCDIGMLLVPEHVRTARRPLDAIEFNQVRRHPLASAVMLGVVDDLPEAVRLASFQHQERDDGSGYPAGVRGAEINDLARVVAVADAFAAATEPRPYKPRKRPHAAVAEMIRLASAGVFDVRAVRALVRCAGLFPVGSYVLLHSGRRALVTGCRPDQPDRPTVRIVTDNALGGTGFGETVDLSSLRTDEERIVAAIDAPAESIRV